MYIIPDDNVQGFFSFERMRRDDSRESYQKILLDFLFILFIHVRTDGHILLREL